MATRIIRYALLEACQQVEDGSLPYVRVTSERHSARRMCPIRGGLRHELRPELFNGYQCSFGSSNGEAVATDPEV